ncbi:MAG: hypothetical protein KDG51_16380, partial [Calditrichaeota bacterium]|nr:hypothetical protein [Calditrichota bacterium]
RVTERFKHYRHNPDDPHSLSGDTISQVFEDHTGALWLVSPGSGVNRYDRTHGRFIRYRHD